MVGGGGAGHWHVQAKCSASDYLRHLLLRGEEVVVGQVDRVRTRDDGQGLGQVVAVREVQVEHVPNLGVLNGSASPSVSQLDLIDQV